MPKFCQRCNKQFGDDVDFCPYCGNSTIEVIDELKKDVCPKCGTQLVGDEIFCPSCGVELSKTKNNGVEHICPYCGTKLNKDDATCPHCGMSVSDVNIFDCIADEIKKDGYVTPSSTTSQSSQPQSMKHVVISQNQGFYAFDFKRRLNRAAYNIRLITSEVMSIILVYILSAMSMPTHNKFGLYILVIVVVIANIYQILISVQRLHDLNQSGKIAGFLVIPIINLFLLSYLIFFKGTSGDNQYGLDPLE
ncbi:DUF805 domain-containing protein [Megasphaera sueciensis]|uniref:DUF805 domain-containing protein n=1 Tax=Megasphaera sueciensis TaxID=349094 RepID=UPI003D06C9FD